MLFGRDEERALVARLLDGARRGTSGAIVVRGDPGVGKTALLADAVARAQDMTILQATGVESEAQLEFSGLLELTRPLLGDLGSLPPHQADVLRGALGFTGNGGRDRFAVGAATLGLLAAAAEERPVLVVVDDAQWLDEASMDALRFAARRLAADAVAFIFATRERDDDLSGAGFAEVSLAGLDLEASRRLLAEVYGDEVASAVAARVHEATAGHPLALVELEHEAATTASIEPLPVGARIERAFAIRVAALAAPERAALLVAAAVGSTELEPIVRALPLRGLDAEALDRAEEEGLVDLRAGRFAFRHPLLRSVVYQRAASDERRDAHGAAAEVFGALGDPERRAWHLAAAAAGLDDTAAGALVDVAVAAQARGAHAAAAAAFERAARLTSAPAERASRLADAADAYWAGGNERRAIGLADELLGLGVDSSLRARVLTLRGVFELHAGTQSRSRELLVEAADLLETTDATAALGALRMAVFGCHAAGDVENSVALARRASDLAASLGEAERRGAAYVLGRSLLLAGESEEAARLLEPAIAVALESETPSRGQLMQAAIACELLEDETRAGPLVARVLDMARQEGPLPLIFALNLAAEVDARGGRWQRAVGFAEEGLRLARDVNRPTVGAQFDSVLARVAAARGDEQAWRRHGEAALESLRAAGMRLSYEQARSTYGLLCLGLDRLDEAVEVLDESATAIAEMAACDRDCSPEVDLVEALARLDRRPEGERRLDRWLERGVQTTVWGPPLVTRLRGLLADEEAYEHHFRAALEAHVRWPQPFERARTQLLFGERLRRSGSRVAARAELRPALAAFVALGAETWAERTRRELRASGQKLRARDPESGDELTPQELQVATQVAQGKSNKEVAAALFLSPKTIEFHLGRIYRKLDVSSRTALARRVVDGELTPTS